MGDDSIVKPGPLEGVSFGSQGLAPPSNLYIGKNDALFITSYNSASNVRLSVRGRFLRADGVCVPIEHEHIPNTNRTANTTVLALGEGFLLNISVILSSGSAKRGQCYMVAGLCQGSAASRMIHTIIAQGYVGTGVNQAWPGNRLETPTEGPGYIRSVTGTNPAAGANIIESVPTGARWRLTALRFQLVTSATVANRRVRVSFDDTAFDLFISSMPADQAASLTYNYNFAAGMPHETALVAAEMIAGLPLLFLLSSGWRILTTTTNLQAGDDFGAPELTVEEWIEV